MREQAVIIGIAGGSASGKTSIAHQLYDCFQGHHKVKIMKQDDYYKDQSHMVFEERTKTNYDHPFAFDTDLLSSPIDIVINSLINRKTIKSDTLNLLISFFPKNLNNNIK